MSLPKIGVEAVVENLDGYKRGIQSVSDMNDKAGDNVGAAAKRFDVLGAATKTLGNVFQISFGNIIANAVTAAFNTILGAINGIINAVGNLAKGVFDAGVKFSSTMANISAVTQITGKDLTQLSKDLIEVGADTAAGPQAVADAYYDVASGVLDASQRMPVLKAAIDTAEAGQANLTATTQGLIAEMNAYGDASGGAAHVSDIFTATVATGVGTMDQFVAALSPLAGLGAKSKISFEEMGGAISFMTAKGIPAEQAATALKAAITQLSRNTPQVTRAIRAMGEKSIEASLAQHGLAGTLALLEKGAKKTGQNFTQMLGSVEALQAATSLGTEEFQKYFDTFVDGVDGATAKARELQRADVGYQLKLIQSRFQAIGLSVGQAVLPAFNKFLTFINTGFKNFDWKKIGAGLDTLGEKLGKTAENLIGKLGTALQGIDFEKLAGDIGVAIGNIGDFFTGIDWTGVANMISGIFAGIGQAVTFIASINWGDVIAKIQAFFTGFAQAVSNFLGFFGGIASTVGGAIQAVAGAISAGYNNVVSAITTIRNGVSAIWDYYFGPTGTISTVVTQAITSVADAINAGYTNIVTAITAIRDGVSAIWGYYFGTEGVITIAVNEAMTAVTGFITGAQAGIEGAFQAVSDAATSVWNTLFGEGGLISGPIAGAMQAVSDAVNGAVAGVRAAFAAISAAITAALAPAKAFIEGIVNAIKAIAGSGIFPGTIHLPSGVGGAGGGTMQEGLNIVGEQGAEAVIKHGSRAVVIPHAQTQRMLAQGANISAMPKGGGVSNYMPTLNTSGLGGAVSSIAPRAVPISVGGGTTNHTSNITNNRNIGSIVLNGVDSGESAVLRLSMLTAAGKL